MFDSTDDTDTTSVWCLKADLKTPVAHADPYIHLDGVLAFAVSRELGFTADDFEDSGPPEHFVDDIPLKRYTHDDEWVWAATAAAIASLDADQREFDSEEWDAETATAWFTDADPSDPENWSTTRWRKRFDHDSRHQAKQTQINISSGAFKSYNAALPYASADQLTFFFEPKPGTDPEYVVDLLEAHVSSLGKKRSQGYGRVRDYDLVEATGTVESALWHGGRTLRSLPASWCSRVEKGIRYGHHTVRPPYWHQANQPEDGFAIPPFEEVSRETLADSPVPVSNPRKQATLH